MEEYKFNVRFFDTPLTITAKSEQAAIKQVKQLVSGAIDASAVPVKHRIYLEKRDWEGEMIFCPVED